MTSTLDIFQCFYEILFWETENALISFYSEDETENKEYGQRRGRREDGKRGGDIGGRTGGRIVPTFAEACQGLIFDKKKRKGKNENAKCIECYKVLSNRWLLIHHLLGSLELIIIRSLHAS